MKPGPRIYPPIKRDEIRQEKPKRFVAGSLDFDWLQRAHNAGATLLALHLYRMACLNKGTGFKVHVKATASDLEMAPSTLNRQLHKLHESGLFEVRQKVGTWPTVYMCESPRIKAPADRSKKRE